MSTPVEIAICLPVDDGARADFWLSLTQLITSKAKLMPDVSFQIITRGGDSLVARARNNLAHDFLTTTKAEYMLFLDTDLTFSPLDIKALIDNRREDAVVCGTYAIKQAELRFVHNCIIGQLPEPSGLLKVAEAGSGCMLIPRKVLEAFGEKYQDRLEYTDDVTKEKRMCFFPIGVGPYKQDHKRYYSEDYFFCRLVQQLGFSVYVHMDVLLKHHGWIAYPLEDAELIKSITSRCVDYSTKEEAQDKLTRFLTSIDTAVKSQWATRFPDSQQALENNNP